MRIELRPRGAEQATTFFYRTDDPKITAMLPRTVTTLEQALENFHQSQQPGATSFGLSVYGDGQHVGDVWCYCMDPEETPEAMLSFCLFEKSCWGKGIATESISMFLKEVAARFHLQTVGAFCFACNTASRRVLEKNGFSCTETFTEDGVESCYYEISLA